ncbi:UBP1-associated protein 2C-like [Nicotiana tomentosiformis]|uniref:UBP1-associated protein 2C-like n=1 Tax=Nicotiana tomentosiformis TaxID=4098 RepID=UPI00388CBC96
MVFLRCLHFLNAIELWLNVRLNKKTEQEMMSLQKMNQLLTNDQLNKIAEGISVFLPGVLENVLSSTKTKSYEGSIQRKLFVGSLGCNTTSETLHRFFSAYGEVEEAVVILDKSGVSKEYGFVIFKHVKSALMALKEPYKRINGKTTITKVANSGARDRNDESLRTVYVANVPHNMLPGRVLEYFSSYGVIEKGPFGFNKETGKSRGYAIFVYKTLEGAKTAIYEPIKWVDGHHLTCEMAIGRTKKKPRVSLNSGPFNLNCHYQNSRSMFGGGGSRPEVSQVGVQYAQFQGNRDIYAQNCHCGLVSNCNIQVQGLSPTVIGRNHIGSGLCTKLSHGDYSLWSSEFPRHNPVWF